MPKFKRTRVGGAAPPPSSNYPRRAYLYALALFVLLGLLLPMLYIHSSSPAAPSFPAPLLTFPGGGAPAPFAFLRGGGGGGGDRGAPPAFRGAGVDVPLPAPPPPPREDAARAPLPAATSRLLSQGALGLRPSATSAPAAAAAPAVAAPAAAAAPAAVGCPAPPPYRGVLDPALLTRTLLWKADPADGVVRFEHAVPGPCKKWIGSTQNYEAGAGHRLREWGTALWVSTAIRPPQFPVAFAHTPVGKGKGMHGEYGGIDEFLGLEQGEGALDSVGLVQSGGQKEFPCTLDVAVGLPYAPNREMLTKWTLRMGNPSDCGFVYKAPPNHWAEDHNSGTRGIMAWKFAAAAAARAAAGKRLPLLPAAAWADPAAVHIGLHFRSGDGLLVPEAVLARIVAAYVLPPLGEELPPGTPLALHVYTNAKDPAAELPALAALGGTHGGALTVSFSGVEVPFRDALWALSQTDIFVGSVSSFSWIVAQFSSRPAALLQQWEEGGPYKWCLEGAGCCNQQGVCDERGKLLMLDTAQRLGRMARCGQLNEGSWTDEARVGTPVATPPLPSMPA